MIGFLLRGDDAANDQNARWTALWTSLLTFLISLLLWVKFNPAESGFQFQESVSWLPEFGVG